MSKSNVMGGKSENLALRTIVEDRKLVGSKERWKMKRRFFCFTLEVGLLFSLVGWR